MPQAIILAVVLLIAGFAASACSKQEPEAGDPGKTVAYYQANKNQAVRDMLICLKQEGATLPMQKQRELGLDCNHAKEVGKTALEEEKQRRIAAGTWPSASASAPTSSAANAQASGQK